MESPFRFFLHMRKSYRMVGQKQNRTTIYEVTDAIMFFFFFQLTP